METVTNVNDQKSLFSSYLEVLENREKKIEADREVQEEEYMQRTQKIYDFHKRHQKEAAEVQRSLQYVLEHIQALEGAVLANGEGAPVPLADTLLRQASALRDNMLRAIHNATTIRDMLHDRHQPHMDQLLTRMESEVRGWSSFLSRASHSLLNTAALMDNIHNLIAVQRRCVSEVSSSMSLMLGPQPTTPAPRRAASAACSTPISTD